jgi:AcrR family transcriptional regulator
VSTQPLRHRLPVAERRAQLLDVAERLFIARGYAAVTMEDIARGANVTRPLPYNHFESKEGVYVACVQRAREEYDAELLSAIDPASHPRDQLAAGADAFFGMLERDQGRWMLLFGSNTVLPSPHSADLAELRFGTIAAIEALLRNAAPDAPPRRITAAAHAASGVGERLGHWWLTEKSMTRAELVDHFAALLWDGLSPYAESD